MTRSRSAEETKRVGVGLPASIAANLQAIADNEHNSLSAVCERIITTFWRDEVAVGGLRRSTPSAAANDDLVAVPRRLLADFAHNLERGKRAIAVAATFDPDKARHGANLQEAEDATEAEEEATAKLLRYILAYQSPG